MHVLHYSSASGRKQPLAKRQESTLCCQILGIQSGDFADGHGQKLWIPVQMPIPKTKER
jgi:hypothetical protein